MSVENGLKIESVTVRLSNCPAINCPTSNCSGNQLPSELLSGWAFVRVSNCPVSNCQSASVRWAIDRRVTIRIPQNHYFYPCFQRGVTSLKLNIVRADGQTDGRTDGRTDGETERRRDGDGETERRIDGQMRKQTNKQTSKQTNKQTNT